MTGHDLAAIRTLAALLDDLEKVRIMNGNRVGAAEREHGESFPHLLVIQDDLLALEHRAEIELKRAWRRHPLAPWARTVKGLGEKSIARLIAEIGRPSIGSVGHWETTSDGATTIADSTKLTLRRFWVVDDEFDRTVGQLWQYVGVGDPSRSRIPKNATQEELLKRGRPRAKKQMYLIAEALKKQTCLAHRRRRAEIQGWQPPPPDCTCREEGLYRAVYDARRVATSERLHVAACPQCRAKPGEPWRPGHREADALRIVQKALLKDMWRADRLLRGFSVDVELEAVA